MLEILDQLDQQLFLFLNSKHAPWLDDPMIWISGTKFWFPFYTLIIGFLVWKFKYRAVFLIVSLALLVTLCDRFSSGFMKPYFERLRPCYNEQIAPQIHLLKGCGGKFGFVSSHAANTFGLAMFLCLLFRKEYKHVWLMFVWAAVVSYSRIYLGVHYPGDLIVGGITGVFWAFVILKVYQYAEKRIDWKKENLKNA